MNPRPLLLAVLALVAAPALAQAPPAPGGLADLTGARALALSAATGVASGNDGIFVNPAATAARRRYSVESLLGTDRRGATDVGKYIGASVVDALSTPVAVALAWAHPIEGDQRGNLFIGGLAGSLVGRFYLGAQLRYYDLEQTVAGSHTEHVSLVTGDAGLFWEFSDSLTLGASGFNLVPTGHPETAPRSVGAGLALGSDRSLKLTVDWRADLDRIQDAQGQPVTTNRYSAGLEALLGDMIPLRAGYMKDETLGCNWWSAGAGLIASNGVALDLGYKQSVQHPDARVILVAVKVQFLEMP